MYLIFCDSLFKMSKIEIKKIVEPVETSDGAGVKLKRSIGAPTIDYLDPFPHKLLHHRGILEHYLTL